MKHRIYSGFSGTCYFVKTFRTLYQLMFSHGNRSWGNCTAVGYFKEATTCDKISIH